MRRTNLAIERHASKIYTRNMFEEFGRLLIEGTAYNVTEKENMRKYITTHNNAAKREKWSRVEYEVTVNEDKSIFTCECGQFEHTGMLCCHALKVFLDAHSSSVHEKSYLDSNVSGDSLCRSEGDVGAAHPQEMDKRC